jgi:hypothetical protein
MSPAVIFWPDHAVLGVGDHQVARAVHGHGAGEVEEGLGRQALVAERGAVRAARHVVDVAGGHGLPVERAVAVRHHPDLAGVVVRVREVVRDDQVALVIHGHAAGAHVGVQPGPAVAPHSGHGAACHRGEPVGSRVQFVYYPG